MQVCTKWLFYSAYVVVVNFSVLVDDNVLHFLVKVQ